MDAELRIPEHEPLAEIPPARTQGQAAFATAGIALSGPIAGSLLAKVVLPDSVWAEALGFFALPLIFMFGYKVWMARLAALAWSHLLSGFARFLWQVLIRRKRPAATEVLPSREKLETLMREALNATSVFTRMGMWFGLLNGAAAAVIAADGLALAGGALFFGASVLYGVLLTRMGRAGFLAFPEGI